MQEEQKRVIIRRSGREYGTECLILCVKAKGDRSFRFGKAPSLRIKVLLDFNQKKIKLVKDYQAPPGPHQEMVFNQILGKRHSENQIF